MGQFWKEWLKVLSFERAQRFVLKGHLAELILVPTDVLYGLCKVPTVRQSFVISTVLQKDSELVFILTSIGKSTDQVEFVL